MRWQLLDVVQRSLTRGIPVSWVSSEAKQPTNDVLAVLLGSLMQRVGVLETEMLRLLAMHMRVLEAVRLKEAKQPHACLLLDLVPKRRQAGQWETT